MMRAAVIDKPHAASLVETDRPEAGPGEVLVRIAYVGLCGSDLEILHGTSAYLVDGRAAFPHRFGHEWVGTVEEFGTGVTGLRRGEVVTGSTMIPCQSCRSCASGRRNLCTELREVGLYGWTGAAAEYLVMPRHALVPFGPGTERPRPEHVLVEPLVTVLEAVDAADPRPGDRILVIGAGTMGSLAAAVLTRYPVTVDIAEPGTVGHLPPGSYHERFTRTGEAPTGYDIVVECSGAPGTLNAALDRLRPGGLCLLVGVPAQTETVEPGRIALDGIRIVGVRHGVDHYARAVALVDEVGAGLVDRVVPLDEVAHAFEVLQLGRIRPKVVLGVG
ncbi:alcohol dehydrogenase catalytic domain-containing protein [Kitasatospora sp. NPDC005856]|uniref:zinc-dependent alcohol dehydrogenase n=1 Tax=Kitasatospora sp. NPDC005856 TaxID=3154566 RepID=UPI0033F45469